MEEQMFEVLADVAVSGPAARDGGAARVCEALVDEAHRHGALVATARPAAGVAGTVRVKLAVLATDHREAAEVVAALGQAGAYGVRPLVRSVRSIGADRPLAGPVSARHYTDSA